MFQVHLLFALLLLPIQLHAQRGSASANWTQAGTDPETTALGRASSMFGSNALAQMQFYPNSISRLKEGQSAFSAQHQQNFAFGNFNYNSYRAAWKPPSRSGTWNYSIGFSHLRWAPHPRPYTNEQGVVLGKTHAIETMTGFTGAMERRWGPGRLELGLGLDWIRLDYGDIKIGNILDGVGNALTFNLGAGYAASSPLWQPVENRPGLQFEAGLQTAINRVGSKIRFSDYASPALRMMLGSASSRVTLRLPDGLPLLAVSGVMERQVDLIKPEADITVHGVPDSRIGDPDNPHNPDNQTGYANLSFQERQEEGADDPDVYFYDTGFDWWPNELLAGSEDVSRHNGYSLTLLDVVSWNRGRYYSTYSPKPYATRGWSFHSRGLKPLLDRLFPGSEWTRWLEKVEAVFSEARYTAPEAENILPFRAFYRSFELRIRI